MDLPRLTNCFLIIILYFFILVLAVLGVKNGTIGDHDSNKTISEISTSKIHVGTTPTSTTPYTSDISNTSTTPYVGPTSQRSQSDGVKLPIILLCVFGVALLPVVIAVFYSYRRKYRNAENDMGKRRPRNHKFDIGNTNEINLDFHPSSREDCLRKLSSRKQNDVRVCSNVLPRVYSENYSSRYDAGFENLSLDKSDVIADVHTTSKTVKKLINAEHGGVLESQYAKLEIGTDCLKDNTTITMMNIEKYPPFEELSDLKMLDNKPLVIEFLPDGLRFNDYANMTAVLPENDTKLELCVLHGSYNSEKERIIWEIVNDEAQVKRKDDGTVTMNIKGFSFYSFILARRGRLSMILSHLNHSFNVHAVALYRRVPSFPGLRLAIVLVSEFVKKKNSQVLQMITQSEENPHSYKIADKSAVKRIDTQRRYEICLAFNEPDTEHKLPIKIKEDELSSRGMVLDAELPEIMKDFPASGKISIFEVYREQRKLIWELCVVESSENPLTKEAITECLNEKDEVERRQGLSSASINRLSQIIGVDWDSLAGLMDIPYNIREEIRIDNTNYPDIPSKAKAILTYVNNYMKSPRKMLAKCSDEIQRNDLTNEIKPEQEDTCEDKQEENEDQNTEEEETAVVLRDTPLSAREMSRISRMIVDWESLAGLMDLPHATTSDIKFNHRYPDIKSKAEKVLDIFNRSNAFCREKLINYFMELRLDDMVDKIKFGLLRC